MVEDEGTNAGKVKLSAGSRGEENGIGSRKGMCYVIFGKTCTCELRDGVSILKEDEGIIDK